MNIIYLACRRWLLLSCVIYASPVNADSALSNGLNKPQKATLGNILQEEQQKKDKQEYLKQDRVDALGLLKPTYKVNDISKGQLNQQNRQAIRPQIGTIDCLSQPYLNMSQTLELIQVVEKAVCFNPETNSAWVQSKIQAAQLGMTKASYYPQISSTANFDWGKDDYQVDHRQDLSYDTNTRRYGITLQANWLLYDFGARKAQVKEAEKLLAMSLSQQNQVLQEVILKTIIAYYQVIQYELKQDDIQQLVTLAKENYNIAHARYQAGAGIKSDELQMSANLAKAQSDLTKLNGDLKVAKGQLAMLMGEPAYQDFKVNSTLKIPSILNLKSIQDLIEQSAHMHPKFKAARLAVDAAREKIKSTQSTGYPSVSLLSNLSDSKQLGESPFANTTQRMQAGVQVSFPIFDGFNNKYQIKVAQENLRLKQLAERQTKLQSDADIWKSYNELQAMHENLIALGRLNESATQAFGVAQGRYKAGVGSMLEVLNAQNVYIEARLNYSDAVTQFLVIRYQLLADLGNLNIWDQ